MSKSNNVNPDHYKVAGRERPGNAVAKNPKQAESGSEKTRAWKWQEQQQAQDRGRGRRKEETVGLKEEAKIKPKVTKQE
jgi:hypothetical protein